MNWKRVLLITSLMVIMVLFLVACGGSQTAPEPEVEEPAAEEPAAEEPAAEEPAAEEEAAAPTEMRMAAGLTVGLENAWDSSFIESFNRVRETAPHGLEIPEMDFTEGVWGDEAEVVLREYAKTGLYDIIWMNSSGSDQVEKLKEEFPEILWVTVGSGNRPLGDNSYLIYQHIYECGYLQGMLAGHLTESNKLGVVGTFPADDVNDVINAFAAGAESVNPDVDLTVSFIESWYDPPKAQEAANAQIAAGVDQMYMMAESFEPCEENGITCYAKYIDYNFAAPDSVLTSAMQYWEPHINYVIDEWYNHETTGEPYAAPMEAVWFGLADDTCELSSFHGMVDQVPEDVLAELQQAQEDIKSGALQIELNMENYSSD